VTDQASTATLNGRRAVPVDQRRRVAFTHRRSVYASDVIVKDAVTGERLYRVSDARYR
jgi:hypothetical protein